MKKRQKKFRRGIFIVVYKNFNFLGLTFKRYLILKRKLHWTGWEFPKGGIEKGENYLDAIKREIFEETGQKPINILNWKKKGRYIYKKKISDRKNISGQTYSLYSAEIKSKKVKIDKHEHSKYAWASYKKALKKITFETQRECLKIVHKTLL